MRPASTPAQQEPGALYREYLRVSKDRSGRGRSIEEQHTDNQQDMHRLGGRLHPDQYRDLSISASRYSTKTRDDFDRLMADLDAGRFGADYLLLWESSRGSRKVGEWVELIELCERRGVGFYVTTHGRHYDPGNGRDRRQLIDDANSSEYASWEASERCRRTAAASANAGAPYGKVPYGYGREYDPATGRLLTQIPDPAEAPVVREIARRLLTGEALYAVAADLTARGVPAPRGARRWNPGHVRRIAMNPTYAGLRTHHGAVVGAATWEGLISETDHRILRATFSDPARRTWRDGPVVRHLLAGIAECGVCGSPCRRVKNRGTPSYACSGKFAPPNRPSRFCVVRVQADLDAYISMVVVEWLSRPDVLEHLTPPEDTTAVEAAEKVRDLRSRLEEFHTAAAEGRISATGFASIEAKLLAEIREAERRAVPRGVPPGVTELACGDAVAGWEAMSVQQRRQVIRALMVVRILPTGKGTRFFSPDSVEIIWRGAS